MNENKQIVRWLGWTPCNRCDSTKQCEYMRPPGPYSYVHTVPHFRTDNQWAGAVLEKLGDQDFILERSGTEWQVGLYDMVNPCDESGPNFSWKSVWVKDWRSAVVDAALEVIRRDASA